MATLAQTMTFQYVNMNKRRSSTRTRQIDKLESKQFRMHSADYYVGKKGLSAAILAKEEHLGMPIFSAANVDVFIEKVKQYTTINELTRELCNSLSSKSW